jgi:pilus assembly protein CpaC
MTKFSKIGQTALGSALAAALAAGFAASTPGRAAAQPAAAVAPTNDVTLSVGSGRMVRFPGTMSDLFVANDAIADVQVRSPNQIYIFGKTAGQTSVYATNRAGQVIYSANVRVGVNLDSVDQLLHLAMPNAEIRATPMSGMLLLTGTVATPADVEEAQHLVQAYVGEGTQVINRLRTATPLQVMLQVKIAEVSRSLMRDVGMNILTRDNANGGFLFGIGRGNPGTIEHVTQEISEATGLPVGSTSYKFNNRAGATTLGAAGRLLGIDVLSTLDLAENSGLITTLAEPTLSALSGETASFLAGGEFPIPVAGGISGTAIEFKQYGVSLAFTPTVLESGRISMRVRPEVSDLSSEGAIQLNGFQVPSLTTRRAETTVELGSGQSFMIAGLMRNGGNNSVDRAPFLGNLPIIGALFRSNSFRRNETELVIVVTPYLVRPVNAGQIALPTDGFRPASDAQRFVLDQAHDSRSGEQRPRPVMAEPRTFAPALSENDAPRSPAPQQQAQRPAALPPQPQASSSPAPGFNF